jgi:hypothetical protein
MFAANPKLLRFRLAEVIADALTRTLEEHPTHSQAPDVIYHIGVRMMRHK